MHDHGSRDWSGVGGVGAAIDLGAVTLHTHTHTYTRTNEWKLESNLNKREMLRMKLTN